MKVELDIFSGRQNPEWQLSKQVVAKLSVKLDELSQVTKPVPEPGLGYRGFVLRDGVRVWRVFQSQVTIESPDSRKTYQDTSGIEADLVAEARQHGYSSLIEGISPSN